MPQLTKKEKISVHLNIGELLKETQSYVRNNFMFVLCVFAINMVYMLCFKALEGGISNPLGIIWIITYYIFWCFFYRYYYNIRPYLASKTVFGSLAPSTKAMIVLLLVCFCILLLPSLPLLLGLDNDRYLNFYENFLQILGGMSSGSDANVPLWQLFLAYGILCLISPMLICKPYLAWIASLRGKNSAFRKIKNRANGNYWQFVIISAMLLFPEALALHLDKMLNCRNWLDYTVSTTIFVYTNIIFAKIYDLFYLRH